MQQILPSYKDPLFSILLIITIILVTVIATHGWNIYSLKRNKDDILKFLNRFKSRDCIFDSNITIFDSSMLKPLTLLAQAFDSSGEYHKAINIYLYLIDNTDDYVVKNRLLDKLGLLYLKAGFLQRAKNIFLKILKYSPRNIESLYNLSIIYDMLNEYNKALSLIEPLNILKEDTENFKNYFEYKIILSTYKNSKEQKIIELEKMIKNRDSLYRIILSDLFILDDSVAWRILDYTRIKEVLDILWMLPKSKLDLDIISKHDTLSTIYYAKGYIEEPFVKSDIFSVDMLAISKKSGFDKGDLNFLYLCDICKQSFSLSFNRCSNCMAINSIIVEEKIAKKDKQTNYSIL